jgi:hypothetical protein
MGVGNGRRIGLHQAERAVGWIHISLAIRLGAKGRGAETTSTTETEVVGKGENMGVVTAEEIGVGALAGARIETEPHTESGIEIYIGVSRGLHRCEAGGQI